MNPFLGRTDSYKHIKKKFTDKEVIEYHFELQAVPVDETADKVDYIPLMVPVKGKSYKIQKLVNENIKGASLRDIVSLVDKTGDLSLLNARKPVYGDLTKMPEKVIDRMTESRKIEERFERMTPSEKEFYTKFAKLSSDDRKKLLQAYADKVNKSDNKADQNIVVDNDKKDGGE